MCQPDRSSIPALPEAFLDQLCALVGSDSILQNQALANRWSGYNRENLAAGTMVLPMSAEHVAGIVKLCARHHVSIVPQGGRTGLVGGAVSTRGDIIVSLERMNVIQSVDETAQTMIVEAGATLSAVQKAAAASDLVFGLDLGSRDICTIGGNIATNAGGARVLRYGMMRSLVLGLEAVLPDGTLFSSMSPLTKNNTGYDLKQLFLGSEGTLGVITRAALRLGPRPLSTATALLRVADLGAAVAVLKLIRKRYSIFLSAFEIMWYRYFTAVCDALLTPGEIPLKIQSGELALLIEYDSFDEFRPAQQAIEELIANFDNGGILDGVVSMSEQQSDRLWRIRDGADAIEQVHPVVYSYDVSLPVACYEKYIEEVTDRVVKCGGEPTLYVFGHLADGNLHFMIGGRPALDHSEISLAVYEPLNQYPYGSISAEHGIGLEKKPYLRMSRSVCEINLMRQVKQQLDPLNILNPGKIF